MSIRVEQPKGGAMNGVNAELLLTPSSDGQTALVIKAPDEAWAWEHGHPYGTAQAIFIMREEHGAMDTPEELVVWRVNGHCSMGLAGGIHVATGLNQDPNGEGHNHSDMGYSIHVDPTEDCVGIYIDAANNAPATEYLVCRLNDGTVVADIDKDGYIETKANVVAAWGTTMESYIGNVFGAAGISLGHANGGVFLHNLGSNTMGVNCDELDLMTAYMEWDEITEPSAPAANKARLFVKDNGAGKTQLCVRFPTGASIVLATQV